MAEVSPLHRVIDSDRWAAECLLGRLIILVHATFLDAGFLPDAHSVPTKSGRVPRWVGVTASTLSLRYVAPRRKYEPVAPRIRAIGMHVVFYVCLPRFAGDARPVMHRACVDACSAAPLLSGGLDDTARALTDTDDGALLAALWRELTEKLSRPAFDGLCRKNALASLPRDLVLAIVARLAGSKDRLRVASTCAELWRLVTDHYHREMEHQRLENRLCELREISQCEMDYQWLESRSSEIREICEIMTPTDSLGFAICDVLSLSRITQHSGFSQSQTL
jgi:hypothetical protein